MPSPSAIASFAMALGARTVRCAPMAKRTWVTLPKAAELSGRPIAEIIHLAYTGALEMRLIGGALVVPYDRVLALPPVGMDATDGVEELADAYNSERAGSADTDDEAERKVRSRSVLTVVNSPHVGVVALADHLHDLIRRSRPPKKKPTAESEARFKATLLSFITAIATIALMRIPPHNGVSIAFGEAKYIGSKISVTALRTIRDALSDLGLIVVRRGFNDRLRPEKSYPTGIRHTGEFADLVRSFGIAPEDVFTPPAKVIAIRDATNPSERMPDDIAASADVIRRYNEAVTKWSLTLPEASWVELERRVIAADKAGKTKKLHRGYDANRIYLTRRFAEAWDRGGRLYDPFFQSLPKDLRAELLIDGEPTVELDYSRLHPTMLFNQEGLKLDRDPYAVPGFDVSKKAAKETFNRLLNSRKKISYRPKDRRYFRDKSAFKRYRNAMVRHLKPISHRFQSDSGAHLQKLDSELALAVIGRCLNEGIEVYPVHDSFIVRRSNSQCVKRIMEDEYRRLMGFKCSVH